MNTAQTSLIAALLAALSVVAVFLAVREGRGRTLKPGKPQSSMADRMQRAKAELPDKWQRRWRPLLLTAGLVTLIVWAWTGWPVHGLLAGAAVLAVPYILNPGTPALARIERLEALGQWLNSLAGIHRAGISLAQTIQSSVKTAPTPIAEHVTVLAQRLRVGIEPYDAYALFADELADGVVDHVMMLFQSHTQISGQGMSDALEALAANIHQQAADAREIEADRAKVRKNSRLTSTVVCVVVVGCMLNEQWSGWYQSPLGQIVLAVLGALFAYSLRWLRRMAIAKPDPRLLNPLPTTTRHLPEGGQR
ncbi:type II secretion system F family protein [Streptomyces sp. SGAir0957]